MAEFLAAAHITGALDLIKAYISGGFLVDFCTVIAANLALSAGNAVIIALAAHSLPVKRRIQGIIFATLAVIGTRVFLIYFAEMLLNIPHMKLFSGLIILTIAVKLLLDKNSENEAKGGLAKMIGIILLADLVISVDKATLMAQAAKGNPALLILGLGMGISIIALLSGVMSRFMGRYPIIMYIGSGLLGKVAAETILGDPFTMRIMNHIPEVMRYSVEVIFAFGVVGGAMACLKMRQAKAHPATSTVSSPFTLAGWDLQ